MMLVSGNDNNSEVVGRKIVLSRKCFFKIPSALESLLLKDVYSYNGSSESPYIALEFN